MLRPQSLGALRGVPATLVFHWSHVGVFVWIGIPLGFGYLIKARSGNLVIDVVLIGWVCGLIYGGLFLLYASVVLRDTKATG